MVSMTEQCVAISITSFVLCSVNVLEQGSVNLHTVLTHHKYYL